MSFVRVVNESKQSVLGARIRMADSLGARLRGFLFRARPVMGEGLLLAPCKGVHMFGMRFPLDVLIIDHAGRIMATHAALAPGRRTPVYRGAHYALELPAGAIGATDTAVGDRLSWRPASAGDPQETQRVRRTARQRTAEGV
jgi:uncharacterized membrane protein (UPF0127 family)